MSGGFSKSESVKIILNIKNNIHNTTQHTIAHIHTHSPIKRIELNDEQTAKKSFHVA